VLKDGIILTNYYLWGGKVSKQGTQGQQVPVWLV